MTPEPKPYQHKSYDGECSRKRLLSTADQQVFWNRKRLISGVLTSPSTIAQSSALMGVLLNRRDVKRRITNVYAAARHMAPDAISAGTRVWFSCASWYSMLADIVMID